MEHEPVLLRETLSWLDLKNGECVIDCTGGSGGHAEAILERISPGGQLIVIDQDPEAIERCKMKLKGNGSSVTFVNENFRNIVRLRKRLNINHVNAILMDLGVSSDQLSNSRRGFSFQKSGPLDMRMDTGSHDTLSQFLKAASEEKIADTIYAYGQDRFSRRIAKAIKQYLRKVEEPDTAGLADVIRGAVPARFRKGKIHPATRSFQAFRIQVNDEFGALHEGLSGCIGSLSQGGRIVVISFHSLEDRIVKNGFRNADKMGIGKVLLKKPLQSPRDEVKRNPRSRSARLRAFRKGVDG